MLHFASCLNSVARLYEMKATTGFIFVSYTFSIALSLIIGLTGGHDSHLIGLGYMSMLLPAVSVLVVSFATKEAPLVSWGRRPLKYLPAALLLMPGILHATMLPLMAILQRDLPWQSWLMSPSDGKYHTPAALGWGTLTIQGLVAHIALNALVGLTIVSGMAFFEEIGWRAWLLPRFTARFGTRRAILVTAIIWALWHVPFELAGILHINGISSVKLALILPPGTLAAGLILGWLWVRTESFWLVALAHGALNDWGQYAFKYMNESTPPEKEITVLSGGTLALLVVGIFLLCFGLAKRTDRV
jgi:uncharacterized protein